ncbi:MAG: AAA family ATPase [Ignavibacteriales bacterium]|nr:AAA family ATPase [Ignavibacteriales bacterium]
MKKLFIGFREFNYNYKLLTNEQISEITKKVIQVRYWDHFYQHFVLRGSDSRIYILIDEYDHFTNELFSFNLEHFQEVVSRNGWVRKFYEVIKQFTGSGLIDRFLLQELLPLHLTV